MKLFAGSWQPEAGSYKRRQPMSDLGDYRIDRPSESPPEQTGRRSIVGGVIVLILLMAIGGYMWLRGGEDAPPTTTSQPRPMDPVAEPARSLGGQPESIEVPPLGEADPVVRTLVQSLSTHPKVVAWLSTDGLIRNFTVVVNNVANGQTPAKQLSVLKPDGRFATTKAGDGLRIDPASYARYDSLAAAVESIDPQGAARVYATLKPRIEEAQRELGTPQPFDQTLEKALVQLVRTPVDVDTRVQPKGAEAFQYVDPRLESLTNAQKLLLRMGPRNAHIVQEKLKAIGLALGIPAERFES
jgi:hypothetical protein